MSTPTPTVTRLLQRQILPIDRDTDVFPLYVDLEDAKLDTDSGKWCSTLSGDRGDEQTYRVGRVFSQYKYSLVLEKSGNTWSVVDVDEIPVGS